MSSQDELSFEKILQFMLQKGGKVTNHELVKHFRVYLTDPANRVEAREVFKKHVNTLASIKNQNNEKWLILKRKYMETNKEVPIEPACNSEPRHISDLEMTFSPTTPNQEQSFDQTFATPPPYKAPPEVSPKFCTPEWHVCDEFGDQNSEEVQKYGIRVKCTIVVIPNESGNSGSPAFQCSVSPAQNNIEEDSSPSQNVQDQQEIAILPPQNVQEVAETAVSPPQNVQDVVEKAVSPPQNVQEILERAVSPPQNTVESVQLRSGSITSFGDKEQLTSPPVQERKKIFSRSNGDGDTYKSRSLATRNSSHRSEHPRRTSVMPQLNAKGRQWMLRASAADYDTLRRMSEEDPNLVRFKGTAMHWACKHGNERLVKLLAGVSRSTVHEKTNGGYTPLHIAMQFRHENIYKLLIDVFDADPNVLDYAGRKAREYPVVSESWTSSKKAAKKQEDKDNGFLRFGSLNLRVKKTTVAVTSFLGVRSPKTDQRPGIGTEDLDFIKPWASAENIPADNWMGPPSQTHVRKTRRSPPSESQSRSTPTTPNQTRCKLPAMDESETPTATPPEYQSETPPDSDSDSAAGFHAGWKNKRGSAN